MEKGGIKEWVGRAKAEESRNTSADVAATGGVSVIRKNQNGKSRGAMIMELAERVRPVFQNFLKDRRDVNGMLFQPAHVRAISLNFAECLVKHGYSSETATA